MDRAIRDCLITGHETLIPQLSLPDMDDRHVLAAAITGHCDIIVSYNLRDFPESATTPFGVEVLHPDTFLQFLLDREPNLFCSAVQKVRTRLRNPPIAVEQYLAILQKQDLTTTTEALATLSALL
jgi:hypothetical protein